MSEKVLKVVRTLRNHWKKSTFVAILGYYGVQYGRDRHKNYLMMREYSREALVHGMRPLPQGAKNKHITIFLNPTAGNRKAKSKLEKYAEPLLHLSGFLVNIVRTERIDEARDLAGVIEKTNIIAAAGGDGTLFETVTGLLRRDDAEEALRRYPVAVIPLGYNNQFAKRVFGKAGEDSEPKLIAESAMAIIKHKIKPQDVMQINIAENEVEESHAEENVLKKPKKPFYSLAGISVGQFREAKKIKDEMPSIFPDFFATFLSLYRTPEQYFRAEIRYIPTCEGCMKCIDKKSVENIETTPQANIASQKSKMPSIWSKVWSIFQPQPVHAQDLPITNNNVNDNTEEEGAYINPQCGNWNSFCVDTSECNIKVTGKGRLQIEVNKKLDKTDFMIEGLKRRKHGEGNFSKVKLIDCKEVEIIPNSEGEFMSIDNEEFEVKPIRVKLLKEKVYFFVPS